MKRIAPLILVAAVALIAAGLFLRGRDPSVAYTENREAWALYEEGESLLHSYRYFEADSLLREAVALDPELAMAHVALAELSGPLGLKKEAGAHLATADSLAWLFPDGDASLLLKVRLSLSEHSQFHDQRDSLLDAARSSSVADHLIVLLVEAHIASSEQDFARAEELYNRILDINPNYASAYNFLGYLYLGQGRYDEAETAIRRYAFVAPDLANPHDSLGDVLMVVGRYEEAEVEFRTALAIDPLFYISQINIGWVYLARGQVDKALELLDWVYGEIGDSGMGEKLASGVIYNLFAHRLYGDLDTYVARYLESHPHEKPDAIADIRYRNLLGSGQTAAALAQLDTLAATLQACKWYGTDPVRTERADIRVLRYRALAAEQIGAHDEAARLFQDILARTENTPPHYKLFDRIHLAYNLIPLQAYDEARVQVADALRVNPRITAGVLVAASIEAAAGQVTEARRLLDTVERFLDRADADYPVLLEAKHLREQLPDPDRI